jgi:DNA-binding GntR family transcriptional regulator
MTEPTFVPHTERVISRRQTTVDEVHSIMLTAIVNGELTAGQGLHDHSWAAELHVSRTPIRESIKRLDGHGIVDVAAARYTRLASFTPADARREARDWAAIHLALVSSVCGSTDHALLSNLDSARQRHETADESRRHAESFHLFEHLRQATESFSIRLGATAAAYRLRLAIADLPDHHHAALTLHADILTALRRGERDLIEPAFAQWVQATAQG